MILPPEFLEELRARVALVPLIQRRVRLVKKGREWEGLCPFHNEKSASFFVNEEKGFFHCFGCGAHGDAIGFVRQAENRSFMEAVELLAAEVGMEMPKPTPAAREAAQRQASLYEVLEAASLFYEAQLDTAAGRDALAYLDRRGLDRAAIKRFRLGYAPAGSLLTQHLGGQFPLDMAVEAGLVVRRDPAEQAGRTGAFDYFRDRVMFPILDRRDRVIAFGGRVMGDAKPKYLNSPETPVFHKGSVLYGLSWARAGVGEGAALLVTEGYMDVIALHRAGFGGAVAPLGTALTEQQLEALWKLAPTPVLCFDGDAAGQRAAARALERALPLVTATRSLKVALLPAGEDPDSLLRAQARGAMQNVVDRAMPLSEFLWADELSRGPAETAEHRAALMARLADRVKPIADEPLRREYLSFFRTCQFERLRMRSPRPPGRTPPGRARQYSAPGLPAPPPDPRGAARAIRIAGSFLVALRHPELIETIVEDFAALDFGDPRLDRLRAEILSLSQTTSGLDAESLKIHLTERGFVDDIAALGSDRTLKLIPFVTSPDREVVLAGWQDILARWRAERSSGAEVDAAVARFERDPASAVRSLHALAVEGERRRLGQAEAELVDETGI